MQHSLAQLRPPSETMGGIRNAKRGRHRSKTMGRQNTARLRSYVAVDADAAAESIYVAAQLLVQLMAETEWDETTNEAHRTCGMGAACVSWLLRRRLWLI